MQILLCRLNSLQTVICYPMHHMKSCKGDRNHVLSGIGITDTLSRIAKLGEAAAKTKQPLTRI